MKQRKYAYAQAEREGNFAKASEIKYGKIVKLEQELAKEQEKLKKFTNTHDQARC